MGDGPYYLFCRPYHLCHVEAMHVVLGAARGKALLTPRHGLLTNVYAYAKRDLSPGERLDGLGGYLCYGHIEAVADDARAPGVPLCLAEDMTLKRAVPQDGKILLADLEYDPQREDLRVYAQALAEPPEA
jgi:predicted homoserine dehydrogenase-like protein